jgi:hypothetical protein
LPCLFGAEEGSYAFDVRAPSFYGSSTEVIATYSRIPSGCPSAQGRPTSIDLQLIEADSAQVRFSFAARTATGLASDVASATFDDGSGPRSVDLTSPWPTFQTRNSGTLHVRFVIAAPDTIATGEVYLPLKKDWIWHIGARLYEQNPIHESFCIQAKSFPLWREIPGADSLYVGWAGNSISEPFTC